MSQDPNGNSRWDPIESATFFDWNGDGHKDMTDLLLQQNILEDQKKSGGGTGNGSRSFSGGNAFAPSEGQSSGRKSAVNTKETVKWIIIDVLLFIFIIFMVRCENASEKEPEPYSEYISFTGGSDIFYGFERCAYYLLPAETEESRVYRKSYGYVKGRLLDGTAYFHIVNPGGASMAPDRIEIQLFDVYKSEVQSLIEGESRFRFLYEETLIYEYETVAVRNYAYTAEDREILVKMKLGSRSSLVNFIVREMEPVPEGGYKNFETDMRPELYDGYYETEDGKKAKQALEQQTVSTKKSGGKAKDYYNVNDYDDPEDFYDDNYGDFEDYEEALDYYEDCHD